MPACLYQIFDTLLPEAKPRQLTPVEEHRLNGRVAQRRTALLEEQSRQQREFLELAGPDSMLAWLSETVKRNGMGEGRLVSVMDKSGGTVTAVEFVDGLRCAGIDLAPTSYRALFRALGEDGLRVRSMTQVRSRRAHAIARAL